MALIPGDNLIIKRNGPIPARHPLNGVLECPEMVQFCAVVTPERNASVFKRSIIALSDRKGSLLEGPYALLEIQRNSLGHLSLQMDVAGIDGPDKKDQVPLSMIGFCYYRRMPPSNHDSLPHL
ncbi:MAG: hypothetical protein A3A24_01430 [Candidatus Buchananbacteria bacterium RIFCSPLOWO2_01_FULL_46_12]|uniref:Uncharacterized protein n=1 Tax=Candidatus Buchananbacteria bacterium RIFCSPLOWO2_01_FULL_46_12 TaxID=1797546 RepID=A0A1G1YSL0_9BACT|nr:MAG: hypothetical protein A3A24_01430 [Candidatus Buchananbacteria bacterium RIFCSPLOWO2_01_FULL_46_12]